ncbi:hypothetical protein ACFV7O_21675 [Streptomyces tendae]|uniref:hypothetical protein n=1 Tax=Streptomyces tendae TaxID=1932 RepID=UPI003650B597
MTADNSRWWLRQNNAADVDKGSQERNRRHLEQVASLASKDDDAMVAHLRNAEAQGVSISPETRMAMGYAQTSRRAAVLLGDSEPAAASVTNDDSLTPEQRIARGYGSN